MSYSAQMQHWEMLRKWTRVARLLGATYTQIARPQGIRSVTVQAKIRDKEFTDLISALHATGKITKIKDEVFSLYYDIWAGRPELWELEENVASQWIMKECANEVTMIMNEERVLTIARKMGQQKPEHSEEVKVGEALLKLGQPKQQSFLTDKARQEILEGAAQYREAITTEESTVIPGTEFPPVQDNLDATEKAEAEARIKAHDKMERSALDKMFE